ncbi:MAG: hypothetical protein K2W82_15030 [Candidatus Obscuribacterales bacterium]|nr:hypothetical protein [Candidatus Obscuribacterales bacterium]
MEIGRQNESTKVETPVSSADTDRFRSEILSDAEPLAIHKDFAQESAAVQRQIADFQKEHAVQVVPSGKYYDYVLSAGGKDQVVLTTDGKPDSLDAAAKKLEQLVIEKQSALTKIFSVTFSAKGENVEKQWIQKPDCTWERGPMIKARSPQLVELAGIEAALYRAQPSQNNSDGTQTKFYFLEDNYHKNERILAFYVHSDKNGHGAVYYEPGANLGVPATEKDIERSDQTKFSNNESIEALTLHELSHSHQDRMGWDSGKMAGIAKEFGWSSFYDKTENETKYLLRGKKGEFYRYGSDHCKDKEAWVCCDKDGKPLDASGKVAGSFKTAKQFTYDQVRDLAEVRPLTWYFPNPKEMFAEGMMFYRSNEERRAQLLRESPTLYAAVKKQDNIESAEAFGKLADGSPKYIRNSEGRWSESTSASRKELADFENKVKAEKQKTSFVPPLRRRQFAYAG